MAKTQEGRPGTYENPVYPHSFPDPFVLKFRGAYFAYCTGEAPDGNVFSILRSDDLVSWSEVGSAMLPLDSRPPFYWAPEVVYDNGKFYLYYSAGNEILMEIRVAVSDRAEGPFADAGVRLTKEEFAIDAHVFIDDDGTRYFFYATDFLEYAQIGTGTVVDRMIDWKTLEGHPRPVTRAKYDWQVYDPARKEKGGVRWYTVEGPAVLKRKGTYFEMFSGGNWQNKTYGVSFAVTGDITSDEEWTQYADGEKLLPVLRTIPDKVVGPGHNSVVRGPNNRELYCIYHRWTEAGRVLAIDRMDFAGDRIFVAGPTTTPQIAPFKPVLPIDKSRKGNWVEQDPGTLVTAAGDECSIAFTTPSDSFLLETTMRFIAWSPESMAGIRVICDTDAHEYAIDPELREARLAGSSQVLHLTNEFDPSCYHLLRLEASAGRCSINVDTARRTIAFTVPSAVSGFEFFSVGAAVEFSAIEMTAGFEELFAENGKAPGQLTIDGGTTEVSSGRMLLRSAAGSQVSAVFAAPFPNFEITANLTGAPDGFGLFFMDASGEVAAHLTVYTDESRIVFFSGGETVTVDLPQSFEGSEYRQFQVVFLAQTALACLEGIQLAELPAKTPIARAAVYAETEVTAEMLRLTAI